MAFGRGLRTTVAVLVLTGSLIGTVACASAAPRGRVYLRVGPPAPIVETRVVSPGPGYVWLPGFYRLEGRNYAWTPGRWDRAPRARAAWVPAHWAHDRRGWYFINGHWR
jgi:hypothetical protein